MGDWRALLQTCDGVSEVLAANSLPLPRRCLRAVAEVGALCSLSMQRTTAAGWYNNLRRFAFERQAAFEKQAAFEQQPLRS